jgi:hypothetical protein
MVSSVAALAQQLPHGAMTHGDVVRRFFALPEASATPATHGHGIIYV